MKTDKFCICILMNSRQARSQCRNIFFPTFFSNCDALTDGEYGVAIAVGKCEFLCDIYMTPNDKSARLFKCENSLGKTLGQKIG